MDVVYALKRQGRTLYGFGGWSRPGPSVCEIVLLLGLPMLVVLRSVGCAVKWNVGM
jgi:hypothetical protein